MTFPPLPLVAPEAVSNIVSFIQLSVAPVFLLTGVGAMLGVLVNRLARIIDRARQLELRYQQSAQPMERQVLHNDMRLLSHRARLVSWAISFCTSCSLFVALIIVTLFLEALLDIHMRGVVPVLFIIAMAAFIIGLLLFLREIYLATAALRIGPPDNETI
jgi:hypothetical protein